MAEMLSPSYWHDVNRYIGELLTGVPKERARFRGIVSQEQKVTWVPQHSEYVEGVYRTGRSGFIFPLGSLFHVVELINPTSRKDYAEEYSIHFDPKKQVVTKAMHQHRQHLPTERPRSIEENAEVLRSLFAAVEANRRQSDELQNMGLAVPSPQDYEVLHAELQHAAGQKLS